MSDQNAGPENAEPEMTIKSGIFCEFIKTCRPPDVAPGVLSCFGHFVLHMRTNYYLRLPFKILTSPLESSTPIS